MTPHAASTAASPAARRSVRLLSYSHATVDFYQGAVAALVSFLVLERGYGYAAAAGVVLASSLASSVVQPLFGVLGDRWRMRWLIPASIAVAGAGIAAVAVSEALWVTVLVAAVSGVGVAAYHPAAAGRARQISGNDHVVMSWFSLGGNLGFAVAPVVVAATVGVLGLRASPLLAVPAVTGIVAAVWAGRVHAAQDAPAGASGTAGASALPEDWGSFLRTTVAIMCRSVVFVGIGSFIVLFMHEYRGVGDALASASLFVFYLGGAVGTALGGHLARRWPRTMVLRASYLVATSVIAGMLLIPGPVAWIFIALTSVVLYVPFSLHVTLGQDYLPRHPGTASGVTLGLAVSVGGVASPVIGAAADTVGLEVALLPLIALPLLAAAVLTGVRDPSREHGLGEDQEEHQVRRPVDRRDPAAGEARH